MNSLFGIVPLTEQPLQKELLESMAQSLASLNLLSNDCQTFINNFIGIGPIKVNGKLKIAMIGHLDNRAELFQFLGISSKEFDSIPDEIIIMEAYTKWKEQCFEYFRGAYAIAIWDNVDKRLICGRDHTGLRPFYYFLNSKYFIFSTNIIGIRELPILKFKLNEEMMASKLMPLAMNNSHTFFEGILRLPAASVLTLKEKNTSIKRYWAPQVNKQISFHSDNDYAVVLRELIVKAVHSRIQRTSPHGILLSGGLDSSAIAVIAARKLRDQGKSLFAVSSVLPENFNGVESDEREFIQEVLNQEDNIDISYIHGKYSSLMKGFENKVKMINEIPNAFHYMDTMLAQELVKHGVKTVLLGTEGDRAASYRSNDTLVRVFKQLQWKELSSLLLQIRQIENISISKLFFNRIFKYLFPSLYYQLLQVWKGKKLNVYAYHSPASSSLIEKYGLKGSELKKHHIHLLKQGFQKSLQKGLTYGTRLIESTFHTFSSYGQEACFPLWDKDVLEFIYNVPPKQFLVGGWKRSLFRRAMGGILPPKIQWRMCKGPYTPDFHRRVLTAESDIINYLETIQNDPTLKNYIEKYIDIQQIKQALSQVMPVSGWDEWEIKTQSVVMTGMLSLKYLMWLKKSECPDAEFINFQ